MNIVQDQEILRDLDVSEITRLLPHRYPFLLLDKIVEIVPGVSAKGYKNVSLNEPFFQGHFPGKPIMPGVLMVEALAQLSCTILLVKSEYKGKLGLFSGIDSIKFKRIVIPGDRLDLECELSKMKGPFGKVKCKASVNGEVAVIGEISFVIQDINAK